MRRADAAFFRFAPPGAFDAAGPILDRNQAFV
jgi:hypothetical protein